MTTTAKVNTSIADKAIILVVTINTLGNHRKLDTESLVNAKTDKSLLNLTKRLLDAPELSKISALDGEIRRFIRNICLPSPFKQGTYTLPIGLFDMAEEKMQEFKAQREKYVDDLIAAYPRLIRDAAKRLDELFSEDDYPSKNELRGAFGLDWQYVEFGAPGKGLSAEVFKREREKIAQQWQRAGEEMVKILRIETAELVSHLVEKLGGNDDGKPKIFRNTTVTNLQEFLDVFDARNIADDKELKKLVDKMKKLVKGVDPDLLRTDNDIRSDAQKKFTVIKDQLDKMMSEKPKRAIRFAS